MKPLLWGLLCGAWVAVSLQASHPLPVRLLKERPKLLLVVVVDQLRGDYLTRFSSRFLRSTMAQGKIGGFEYLKEKGAYFPHGQYEILQAMTGPGHATVLTGSYPYLSGIPLNQWFDSQNQRPVYCAQDGAHALIGARSQDAHAGTSPKNLLTTTLGDELKNAGYPSRVVSIALKDRSAIFMGGHRAEAAVWMDTDSMRWVSSRFYFPSGKLPPWVAELNRELEKDRGKQVTWHVTSGATGLSLVDAMPLLSAKVKAGFGTTFPHRFNTTDTIALTGPYGLEVTTRAAERALDAYALGRGKATDVLAVGYSSHDYLGHAFGPNSLEMEEMTLEVDKNLSRLFNAVAQRVEGGMKHVLVVLTADHGVAPNPDWLRKVRVPGGRIDEDELARKAEARLVEKWGRSPAGKWISHVSELNFYLHPSTFQRNSPAREAVEEELKVFLRQAPEIHSAFTATDYALRRLPPGLLEKQIRHTYFPGRNGDVVALARPFYMVAGADETVTHMTGYRYDSTVPILFAGAHIRPGLYPTYAGVVDIAPTLAFLLGVLPPATSEGRVLAEILR